MQKKKNSLLPEFELKFNFFEQKFTIYFFFRYENLIIDVLMASSNSLQCHVCRLEF